MLLLAKKEQLSSHSCEMNLPGASQEAQLLECLALLEELVVVHLDTGNNGTDVILNVKHLATT